MDLKSNLVGKLVPVVRRYAWEGKCIFWEIVRLVGISLFKYLCARKPNLAVQKFGVKSTTLSFLPDSASEFYCLT